MLAIFVWVSILASGAAKQAKKSRHCHNLQLDELCSQAERCRDQVPDLETMCAAHRGNQAHISTTVIASYSVSSYDVSAPVILELTRNMTVAPGDGFQLDCLAEGAPAPDIGIAKASDSDLRPVDVDWDNSADTVSSVVRKSYGFAFTIKQDEGWYRCVAKNSQGVVYQDTYLTVATFSDICAGFDCPAGLVCSPDPALGTPSCICPSCSDTDWEEDPNIYCGSDCNTYFSKCSFAEHNCNYGVDVRVLSEGPCLNFSLPEYKIEKPSGFTEGMPVASLVELTCTGTSNGDIPGPPPQISWYDDWGWIGDGEVLSYVLTDNTSVVCVGHHCLGSDTQARDNVVASIDLYIKEETEMADSDKLHEGSSCQITGDPFVKTFDNLWYKADGVCTYVISMDCTLAQWFVYGRFATCGSATCLESVTLYYGRTIFELQRGWIIAEGGRKLDVKMGDTIQYSDHISYTFDGEFLTVTFGEENQVRWNGYNGVQVVTPTGARTCGMCGNNNENPGDDMQSRWLGRVDEVYTFVSSWAIRQRNRCYENVQTSDPEMEEQGNMVCTDLFMSDYMAPCHDTVDIASYISGCQRSYATSFTPDYRPECGALQAYVLECETRGVNLPMWRKHTLCSTVEEVQEFTISQGCPQENPPV